MQDGNEQGLELAGNATFRHSNTALGEQLFGLVFVEVHEKPLKRFVLSWFGNTLLKQGANASERRLEFQPFGDCLRFSDWRKGLIVRGLFRVSFQRF